MLTWNVILISTSMCGGFQAYTCQVGEAGVLSVVNRAVPE
jgi:hypothetical protein